MPFEVYTPRFDHTPQREIPQVPLPVLAREVAETRLNPQKEAICLLPGTGMHVKSEISAFLHDIHTGISVENALLKLEENVKGFEKEYPAQLPVFAINLKRGQHDGRERILGGTSAGGLWTESTDRIERDGVVRDSVDKMEEFLLHAPEGSLAVMISPKGWSGYQVNNTTGNLEKLNHRDIMRGVASEVKFPDQQVYGIEIKPGGVIEAYTFKSSMDLTQGENLRERLTGEKREEDPSMTERERIKALVGDVLYFSPEDKKSVVDIVNESEHILGPVMFTDEYGKDRTADEARHLLNHSEVLNNFDQESKKRMEEFKEYAKLRLQFKDGAEREDLEVGLGLTVLKMMHGMIQEGEKKPLMEGRAMVIGGAGDMDGFDPRAMLQKLQELPGCAGGGGGKTIILDSLGVPRVAQVFGPQTESYDYHDGNCVSCGKQGVPVGPCAICKDCVSDINEKELTIEPYRHILEGKGMPKAA